MADKTIIAWTHHTFNVVWGCQKVSEGCRNCYAYTLSSRYGYPGIWGPPKTTSRRVFGEGHWSDPRKWQKKAAQDGVTRLVFSSSMCDNFEDHPQVMADLQKLWPVIRETPNLHWQLLTKRPERITESLPADWGEGYPNVWLGVSVEDMRVAERVDHLRRIPAVVRFISYEPALGSLNGLDLSGIDWLIYGGESGPGYRDHDPQWARDMRARCGADGRAFFFKQSPAPRTEMGTQLDGETIRKYPTPRLGTVAPLDIAIGAALLPILG